MKRPVQQLADLLKKNNLTIAFAESMTCGMIAHKLGTISGTGDIFPGSIVCYDQKIKIKLFKVKKVLLDKYTAESQQVTDALAVNLKKLITADIHAAITGLASPGGSETKIKPVGTVFFAFTFRNKLFKAKRKFNGSPLEIRKKAVELFFEIINRSLKKVLK
jgi:nicotinamide-nucleotide amidase